MIRQYKESGRERLIEIFKLNSPKYFDPEERIDFEDFLVRHGDTFFVIEHDNSIVGCGGYHFQNNGTVGRISWDFFYPDYQGKGYGRQLVQYCLEKLKKEPLMRKLEVWTSQHARDFYARFGFVTREIKKDFWGQGLDLYLMEMDK